MDRVLHVWDGHLADPQLTRTLGRKLPDAAFTDIRVAAVIHLDTSCDPGSVSSILMKFVIDYVTSHGISQDEADAWANELAELNASGEYFYSSNEYIFTGAKP